MTEVARPRDDSESTDALTVALPKDGLAWKGVLKGVDRTKDGLAWTVVCLVMKDGSAWRVECSVPRAG
jgi:hypothetical protein